MLSARLAGMVVDCMVRLSVSVVRSASTQRQTPSKIYSTIVWLLLLVKVELIIALVISGGCFKNSDNG